MVKSNMPSQEHPRGADDSSLVALSRTLEALEGRLSKMTAGRPGPTLVGTAAARRPDDAPIAGPIEGLGGPSEPSSDDALSQASPTQRKPSLADAVSQIVMRRQMLDRTPRTIDPSGSSSAAPRHSADPMPERLFQEETGNDDRLDQRFRALAGAVEALKAEGNGYSLMAEVADELQRLRQDLREGSIVKVDPRFDAVRNAFDALRRMFESGESADVIKAELSRVGEGLARLTEDGADRSTLNTLRAELEEMRSLFGAAPGDEQQLTSGEPRWQDIESRFTRQAERDTEARRDLKSELVRLRESLQSLASEDHIRAVEKRWDEFESRYLEAAPAPSEEAISKLLRDELETLRDQLENMSGRAPVQAADERWDALEERLDSREVETSIQHLADRMGEIEKSLALLPQNLGIAALEERVRTLAEGVETLTAQSQSPEIDHFLVLEDRLDEISRAIVATSATPPVIDMAPIERIEARIATLSARVDRFPSEGDAEILSGRIADLSARVEDLASSPATDAMTARIAALGDRLETAFAEIEAPRIDTAAIEERLSALALRLEDAMQPQVDAEMVRSLELQIARLSQHLGDVGQIGPIDVDHDFDRRLAAVEQRLDEQRDQLIAAAREIADETARRMQAAGDQRQSEHVAQLSENLRSLEALSRQGDERSSEVFDSLQSTLLKIVDRLEQIERDIGGRDEGEDADNQRTRKAAAAMAVVAAPPLEAAAASEPVEAPAERRFRNVIARHLPGRRRETAVVGTVAAAHDLLDRQDTGDAAPIREKIAAPSLDTSDMIEQSEANRPLEPGSGVPDIGALLERLQLQRGNASTQQEPMADDERRAAARAAARQAKAAVIEAEMLRSPSAAGAAAESRSPISDFVMRRRKPILMAVLAVVAALAALPLREAFQRSEMLSADGTTVLQGTAMPDTAMPGTAIPSVALPTLPIAPMVPAAPKAAAAPSAPAPVPAPVPAKGDGDRSESGGLSTPPAVAVVPTPVAPMRPTATPAAPVSAPARPVVNAASASGSDVVTKAGMPLDAASTLRRAELKLPASASGELPAVPEGIGSAPLMAAAKAGEPKALFEIGLRLMEGRRAEPKPAEALAWFAQAAKRGFAPAQYSLGTLFEKGNGIARDTGAARDWYLLAAAQGSVRAMHNLAVLYATGIEGVSEPETAVEWFVKAADYGMRDSQYNLGILYARGSGADQDLAQSYKWFAIVAKSGDKDAESKQQEIAKSLTPAQLKAAEAAVSGWSPKARPEEANTVDLPKEWADASEKTASVDMKRAVRNIQAILGKLGYDAGVPDGVIGGKTKNAIMAFQQQAGLKATGSVDEPLIRALLERKDG